MTKTKVLCIGEEWRGSNASGLFNALSRQGLVTSIVNERTHVSGAAKSLLLRAAHRILRPWQVRDFSIGLQREFDTFRPDWVLVYKGAFLEKGLLQAWRAAGVPVVLFFPDVSFSAHGPHIPQCIPEYDHIFTTKTFAAEDLRRTYNYPASRVSFIPHGFDPLVHRQVTHVPESMRCEVSFIGSYSPHKAVLLEHLKRRMPGLKLKIWGDWRPYRGRVLNGCLQGYRLVGDAYAAALSASAINLGLLIEQVAGASSGDRITSRTFHIPASGGFLLHERTTEALIYFQEGEEAAFFGTPDELVTKVRYFLERPAERAKIAQKGHARAVQEYSLDLRAKELLAILGAQWNGK